VHHVLTGQLLHLLEDAHHAYVVQEGLDINNEPEASYIPEKRALLERLKTKKSEQFKKLVVSVQPVAVSQQPNLHCLPKVCLPSHTWTTHSRMIFSLDVPTSHPPAGCHKAQQSSRS
jgi:transcription initiation factor IIE alpha subunit